MFQSLRKCQLPLKLSKGKVTFNVIEYLGHLVGAGNTVPQDGLLKKFREVPRPKTKHQVWAFLGLIHFYRAYIENFTILAIPLTELTKKRQPDKVKWGDHQERAFEELKTCLNRESNFKIARPRKYCIL